MTERITVDTAPASSAVSARREGSVGRREVSSRIAKFYEQPLAARLALLAKTGLISAASEKHLAGGGGLSTAIADRMSENVIASHGLPLGVALNFRVNDRDVLVPMAVEEPSVIAAASNAARLVRASGGFYGEATASIMTAQVQLDFVPEPERAAERVAEVRAELLALGDQAIPRMVARGGGCRDVEVRVLDALEGIVVVHLYIDVGDAMGANLVDAVAEAVAPRIAEVTGGSVGLRILSNLPLKRMVKVRARVAAADVGGVEAVEAIARASRFAELDPFRAATHNKGIMNGIDAVAVALGQDWRSIEAGAHAYAALSGRYRPLATWRAEGEALAGELEMPLAAATVGGATRAHPGVLAAFELAAVSDARELAVVIAAAGLASNLAALKALAGEGIQRGHMRLHHRLERDGSAVRQNGTANGAEHGASSNARHGSSNGAEHGASSGTRHGSSNGAEHGASSGTRHGSSNGAGHDVSNSASHGNSRGGSNGTSPGASSSVSGGTANAHGGSR